jgi:maltooligosyltrehalose trehalohydrolase
VEERAWRLAWSSEDPNYGGSGTPEPARGGVWRLLGQAAIVLISGEPTL